MAVDHEESLVFVKPKDLYVKQVLRIFE